jgi:serine/threonine protein kinase
MVHACVRKVTGKVYAMKIMQKKRVKDSNCQDLVLMERKVLGDMSSQFVISLRYAFKDKDNLYLLMDIMTGGDMAFHLGEARGRMNVDRIRYNAAQIILGLEHMHRKNFVYRDLKPANIMLNSEGNACITDLGLVAEITPQLRSVCGTRGYWAPEMIGKRRTQSIASNPAKVDSAQEVAISPEGVQLTEEQKAAAAVLAAEAAIRGPDASAPLVAPITAEGAAGSTPADTPLSTPAVETRRLSIGPGSDMPSPAVDGRRISLAGGITPSDTPAGSPTAEPRRLSMGGSSMAQPGKYGKEVDYWSLGCVIYELHFGRSPFRRPEAKALDPDEKKGMDKAVLTWTPPYEEKIFSPQAKDLLQKLLLRDPTKRLGANGVDEIKQHPFFENIDWGLLAEGKLPAPWKPVSDQVNALDQSSIGVADDVKAVWEEADEALFTEWDFNSSEAMEREFVELLQWQEIPGADASVENSKPGGGGGCCTVL